MKLGYASTVFFLVALSACRSSRVAVFIPGENPLGPYSAAVAAGHLYFVSGKIGERGGTFAREVTTAIAAVSAELRRSQLTLSNVVAITVYLTDMAYNDELNEIYAGRFSEPYPTRTCVAVTRLPGDARIEIQAMAWRNEQRGTGN